MNRRSFLNLSGSAFLVLSATLTGCNNASNDTNSSATNAAASNGAAPSSALKVALLTPGDINDQGWNQLANEGLLAVKKELGAQTAQQWTRTSADQLPALRALADEKYDLVICHGFEYGERVNSMAAKYPHTMFVVVGGNVKQEPNVVSLVPKLEEATYLLGMAAAGISKTGTIGALGGMRLPVVKSTFDAFEAGARAVNPRVRVLVNYVGNFDDQNKAKEAAKSMIAQGADVLFHNADQAGKGLFNAAEEAQNVLVFGSNRNQNGVAPRVCLASAVIEMPRAFVELARDVQNKKLKAGFRELNVPGGTIAVEWNDALKSRIPAALMKRINQAQKKIQSGALKIKRNV